MRAPEDGGRVDDGGRHRLGAPGLFRLAGTEVANDTAGLDPDSHFLTGRGRRAGERDAAPADAHQEETR